MHLKSNLLDRTAHVKPCEVQQRWPGISMTQFHIIGSDLSDRCSQTFFPPGCYVEETSQQYLRGSAGERWDMSRQMGLSRMKHTVPMDLGCTPFLDGKVSF